MFSHSRSANRARSSPLRWRWCRLRGSRIRTSIEVKLLHPLLRPAPWLDWCRPADMHFGTPGGHVVMDLLREFHVFRYFVSDTHAAMRSRLAISKLAVVYPDAADYPNPPSHFVAVCVRFGRIALVTCSEVARWSAIGFLASWAGIRVCIWTADSC